jgi:hypothetical protein
VWSITPDVDEFHAGAGPSLLARPAENALLLTIAARITAQPSGAYSDRQPLFGWHPDGSAFVWTPPFPLVLGGPATPGAADELAGLVDDVPAINSTDEPARAFAGAWCQRTGATALPGTRSRLYRLDELVPPAVPGRSRVADTGDRDLMISWVTAFAEEAHEPLATPAATIDNRLGEGGFTLWEDDGAPVAFAGVHAPAGGVVRVGPVYTPPANRGRGYGSAVTAAVSAAAAPHLAVLFTDLANPTSNSIYIKIGYRPVEDRQIFTF